MMAKTSASVRVDDKLESDLICYASATDTVVVVGVVMVGSSIRMAYTYNAPS